MEGENATCQVLVEVTEEEVRSEYHRIVWVEKMVDVLKCVSVVVRPAGKGSR